MSFPSSCKPQAACDWSGFCLRYFPLHDQDQYTNLTIPEEHHLILLQGSEAGSSSERTRTAITAALCKKLKDLMGEFQNLRARLQDEYRLACSQGCTARQAAVIDCRLPSCPTAVQLSQCMLCKPCSRRKACCLIMRLGYTHTAAEDLMHGHQFFLGAVGIGLCVTPVPFRSTAPVWVADDASQNIAAVK